MKRYLLFILNACFLLVLTGIEIRNYLLVSELTISLAPPPAPMKLRVFPDPPLPAVSIIVPTVDLVVESEPILMQEETPQKIVELILDPAEVPLGISASRIAPMPEIVELLLDPVSVPFTIPVPESPIVDLVLDPFEVPVGAVTQREEIELMPATTEIVELVPVAAVHEEIVPISPEMAQASGLPPKGQEMPERLVPEPNGSQSPPQNVITEPKGNQWPLPRRMYLSHVDGVGEQAGISYGTDYATFQVLLAPDYRLGEFMYMVDLRGHRFDNNTYAANAGLGVRYIPELDSFCELLGLNSYYDYREGFIGDYHQIGIGLEVLGRRWDFRANGYIPLGAAKNLNVCNYSYPGGYEMTSSDCEFATYGFNAEVGWLAVRGKQFLLYMATGPYFLTRSTCCFDTMRGFEFRVRPQFKDYFAVEGKVSWDNVYEWVYQTQFIVSLPLYAISRREKVTKPCGISERQIYQPVERFEIMPLGRKQCWTQNF